VNACGVCGRLDSDEKGPWSEPDGRDRLLPEPRDPGEVAPALGGGYPVSRPRRRHAFGSLLARFGVRLTAGRSGAADSGFEYAKSRTVIGRNRLRDDRRAENVSESRCPIAIAAPPVVSDRPPPYNPFVASFLTGATGFIGTELLRRLLARDADSRVYALVRARDDDQARARGREVLYKIYRDDREATESAKARIVWVRGDARRPLFGIEAARLDEIASEVREVYHAAASTEFTLPLDEARAVNVEGVRGILALAGKIAARGRLERIAHLSTAYVAGRRSGRCVPEDIPEDGEAHFNNTYERTKAEAERLLRERTRDFPITVFRPSIVVGDSRTGRTYNFNVLYYPIKLIHRGVLPCVPGLAATTLDIVPVDYVCDAVLALARDEQAAGRTYHLTADRDAIPLRRFLDDLIAYYNRERARAGQPPFGPVRIVGPLRWRTLAWWTRRRIQGRAKEQFESFCTYLPYLFTEKRFEASATRAELEGRVPYPPIESYLERIAEYAVTREWGRRVSWDLSSDSIDMVRA
jgi:thioester reductase-like protein